MNKLIEALHHIQKRPEMYGRDRQRVRSIYFLAAFINGYETARIVSGVSSEFSCFTEWVATHYHVLLSGRGGFDHILEHMGGDEVKAFDEFYRLLPDYVRDIQQLGQEALLSRFCEVQNECTEAFKREMENHDT